MTDAPPAKRIRTADSTGNTSIEVLDGPESAGPDSSTFIPISEQAVGIRCFVRDDLPRFTCQLKQLNSDFQVFEVDPQGKIVRLENVPRNEDLLAEQAEHRQVEQKRKQMLETKSFDLESDTAKRLQAALGQRVWTELLTLAGVTPVADSPATVSTEVIDDKETRTLIHKGIREVFGDGLDSTSAKDSTIVVRVKRAGKGRGAQGGGFNARARWEHPGDFCLFTLYKDGRDTMDAVSAVASQLHLTTKAFGFAGTKDRRGCTTQRFTAYRVPATRLANCNRFLDGIRLGDFSYTRKGLTLGDLSGNRFSLVLRHVQGIDEAAIHERFATIRDRGFINYFGLQRFGTSNIGTHEPGILLLRGEYEQAVEMIMTASAGNLRGPAVAAKAHWQNTHDPDATLRLMPSRNVAETSMLKHMVQDMRKRADDSTTTPATITDWHGAYMAIPRNLRTMYLHAYQSFVWNHAVSARIEQFGFTPVEGDLVIDDRTAVGEDGDGNEHVSQYVRARALTKDDLHLHAITDIVLPLPGYDVEYPANETLRKVYVDVMQQHGLDPFDMRRKLKDLSLPGAYRKIVSKPIDLEFSTLHYPPPKLETDAETGRERTIEVQLAATDLDRLEGRTIEVPASEGGTTLLAVKCEFGLDTAAYATMMLREAVDALPRQI
ncbi:multisubstrate pseudouridine synthase 7 [Savitreella phatthalungensis]